MCCMQAHFVDGFSVDLWHDVLSAPQFFELIDGVRGLTQADQSAARSRAEAEHALRQKMKVGPVHISSITKQAESKEYVPGSKIQLEVRSGGVVRSADLKAVCQNGFSSILADVGVTAGKWYYQVILGSKGVMQVCLVH
jgi:hypothetical protein